MYFAPASLDLGFVAVVRDEYVEPEAQQLQGDVRGQQLPGRGHQHHAHDGEQQDAVVLAGVVEMPPNVVHASQYGEDADDQEERLEEERVAVNADKTLV